MRLSAGDARTALAVGALLLLLAAACGGASGATGGTGRGPGVGKPAPAFTLKSLDGADVDIASLRGRVVLVNFWATWCEPCKAEMPAIESVYRRLSPDGFSVLGVDYRDQPDDAQAFLRRRVVSYPLLVDANGSTGTAYHLLGVPTSYLLDRSGTVRVAHTGPLTARQLTELVMKLLKEPAATTQAEVGP